jgi:hypothetical protein
MISNRYKRNVMGDILWIFLGVIIALTIFKDGKFIFSYDGLRLAIGFASIAIGIWGLVTPLVTISENEVKINLSIEKRKIFVLDKTKIDMNEIDGLALFTDDSKSITVKLKGFSKSDKEHFIQDIKSIIEKKYS